MQNKMRADTLIKSLRPSLHEGTYVFCLVNEIPDTVLKNVVCFFRENEGITLIMKKEHADEAQLTYTFPAAWITLTVHTSLNTVGLTAAFSKALAEKGISSNVVAGYYHDHIFVPIDKAQEAMMVLNRLSGSV